MTTNYRGDNFNTTYITTPVLLNIIRTEVSIKYILQYHVNSTQRYRIYINNCNTIVGTDIFTFKDNSIRYYRQYLDHTHTLYNLYTHHMSNKKRKTSSAEETTEVEFEYTGIEEKREIPKDVTIVRFHSSVTVTVTEVGDRMFKERRQLKEVILNEGLQKIGDSSFSDCSELKHINLPSTVTEISGNAFYNCTKLKKVVLNEGLQKIGNRSFHSCYELEHINLPSTVTELGWSAFCGCHSLMTVILNNKALQTIGKYAFASCLSLESITIPPSVTDISESTFFNCPRLREVDLHEGIQKISSTAFESCSSLERFTFPTLSARLDTIIEAGKYEYAENKIDGIRRSVERRGSEMFVSDKRLVQGQNWKRTRVILGRIDRLIAYYEVKEATTLLELAMWKSKMDQAEVKPINKDVYRIDIPGPVKNTILQYLNYFRV